MRALGIDPVHDTRRTFDGLLEAMSRPGTVHAVLAPADHAVVATLVDHEVTLATDDETVRAALTDQGRLKRAPCGEADVVHVREHTDWDVRDCKRGSLVEPSDGATVVYRVETLEDDASDGTTLSLSGPGVDGTATLSVALPETELSALAAAQSDYPRGVDAIFATEDRVAALPRSVTMEVV
ncbi:phosphonate C-P lyase system protein PhnH [Natronorubrum halophilum]|uniref:phosphonate C-P lyase system protein PhnH n=1 Tax=Natronorubrum halophilum TaxID=1702106 RepID=UPI0010C23FBB|nr:phosphonate C-P lyase system protein PhnH [Natronorubrum halophilum]